MLSIFVLARYVLYMNKCLLLFLCFAMRYLCDAQVLPLENSMMNYRMVGFSCGKVNGCNKYLLEIALGNFYNEDSFSKHIVLSTVSSANQIIAIVPYFGKPYTWQISCKGAVSSQDKPILHHFSTTFIPDLDTNNTRLRIIKDERIYKDAVVFLDGNRAMYDMKGHVLWYLPTIDGLNNESLRDVRDMKLSPQGTITFLLNNIPYEIDYDGQVIWKGPNDGKVSGDTAEHYHHEFTRLRNGHYMVLGSEYVKWRLPANVDSNVLRDGKTLYDSSNKFFYQKLEFGTIIEYDKAGAVVWSWSSAKYFRESDVQSKINGNLRSRDVHENSFFFDEKDKVIYVSFRNISRILKVQYPDGKVVAMYGNKYEQGVREMGNNLFCNQHSVKHSPKGYLYLFNNNFCNKGAAPRIIRLQESSSGKNQLKKIWEFECPMEGGASYIRVPFASGGNVTELPGGAMFSSLANDVYSNVFIVSANKKILWSAIPEKMNQVENKWETLYQYRASIICNEKDIAAMIWESNMR